MQDNIEFSSVEELYKRIYPALSSKKEELRKLGLTYIKERDIWDYLVEKEWKNEKDLELHNLVGDILYLDKDSIYEYKMSKISNPDIVKNKEDSLL